MAVVVHESGYLLEDENGNVLGTGSVFDGTARTGSIAETVNQEVVATTRTIVSGTIETYSIDLPARSTISAVTFMSIGAGSGMTHQFGALVDRDGLTRLATSADGTSGAWGANSEKTFTFTTPYVVTRAGLYYVAIEVTGTVPTLAACAGTAVVSALAPITAATNDTSAVSIPATLAAATAVANKAYAWVS